ncbi:MAG: hydrogenase expression/formation protein HypE [Thermodesulfobacteriota bacterium]
MQDKILLDHGSGGGASQRLIKELFVSYLGNDILNSLDDAACLQMQGRLAFSTDTFTVDPLFFPGGDIGSLAVHGTVNDVAMLGARPRYLSCGFILEEGLSLQTLEDIVASMARAAKNAEVQVVTGDTKVVPKGKVDKIFINTSGLGEILVQGPPAGNRARAGDAILLTGGIGEHGLAVLAAREELGLQSEVRSDSAALNHMLAELLTQVPEVHVLRDPTRGGLASTLNEIADQSGCSCLLQEEDLPVDPAVIQGCSLLGLDPLYLANEGKAICILPRDKAELALQVLRSHQVGKNAAWIGEVQSRDPGRVVLRTRIKGHRILAMLEGEQLPRIC